jgi:LCP family protein required for cell wall assembly
MPAVAGVVVMLIVLTGGYAAWAYNSLNGSITQVHNVIQHIAGSTDKDGKAQNILLVGDDHRPAGATQAELDQLGTTQDGGSSNTDTMIVLHISADAKSATMISFPRDSWVNIPGFGTAKLNSAFSDGSSNGGGDAGGARLLIKTIQNISGLTIDHYVRVSLLGFYQIVQKLGPVQVCLKEATSDSYSGINLPAGVSTLDAKQALAFVRQRHGLPNGDLDREVRQQYFLTQEAKKILSAGTLLNPIKTTQVLNTIGTAIQTDMSGSDRLSLLQRMRGINVGDIRSATIPTSGTPTVYVNGTGVSTVALDTDSIPAFIQGVVGAPPAYANATAAAPAGVSVVVQNASLIPGAATTAGTGLASRGFKVGAPTDASQSTSVTHVEYPAGSESAAKAVAAAVSGGVQAVVSKTATQITLVLGTDGKSVVSVAPSTQAAAPSTPASKSSKSTPSKKAASTPSPASVGNAYGASGTCID